MTNPPTSFQAFIQQKGIDQEAFQCTLPGLFAQYEKEFERGGPSMLEYGKKFFWNDLRLEFPNDKMDIKVL
jgi:hypothetical protein